METKTSETTEETQNLSLCFVSQNLHSDLENNLCPESEGEKTEDFEQVTEWTVEELLISLVEVRPPLWDSRLALKERSKTIRDKLWLEIYCEFGENPQFSMDFLQKKWRNLRDTFVRIKSEYIPSGSGAKRKKKKWEYFDLLSFLNETIDFRPTVSNISKPSSESPVLSPIVSDTEIKGERRQKKTNVEGAILEALEKVNKVPLPIQPLVPEGNINPICIRISEMLNMTPQRERTLLEIKLLQVAYEGCQDFLK